MAKRRGKIIKEKEREIKKKKKFLTWYKRRGTTRTAAEDYQL